MGAHDVIYRHRYGFLDGFGADEEDDDTEDDPSEDDSEEAAEDAAARFSARAKNILRVTCPVCRVSGPVEEKLASREPGRFSVAISGPLDGGPDPKVLMSLAEGIATDAGAEVSIGKAAHIVVGGRPWAVVPFVFAPSTRPSMRPSSGRVARSP